MIAEPPPPHAPHCNVGKVEDMDQISCVRLGLGLGHVHIVPAPEVLNEHPLLVLY